MWVCKKCNEKLEDNFDSCWKCYEFSEENEKYIKEEKEIKRIKRIKGKEKRKNIQRRTLRKFICVFLSCITNLLILALLFYLGLERFVNGFVASVMFLAGYQGFKSMFDFNDKKYIIKD